MRRAAKKDTLRQKDGGKKMSGEKNGKERTFTPSKGERERKETAETQRGEAATETEAVAAKRLKSRKRQMQNGRLSLALSPRRGEGTTPRRTAKILAGIEHVGILHCDETQRLPSSRTKPFQGLGCFCPPTQGSSFLATQGWRTQSLWDWE